MSVFIKTIKCCVYLLISTHASAFNIRNFGNDLFSLKNVLAARAFVYSLRQRVTEEVLEGNNIASQFEKIKYVDVIGTTGISGGNNNLYNHNTDFIHTLCQDFVYISIFALLSCCIFKSLTASNTKIDSQLTKIENNNANIERELFPSKLKQSNIYYSANRLAKMFLLIFYFIFTRNVESAT